MYFSILNSVDHLPLYFTRIFGLCAHEIRIGTPHYMAPEIMRGHGYGTEVPALCADGNNGFSARVNGPGAFSKEKRKLIVFS